eukprot:c3425_g1_i1.p1 GENE.c3425_g1_i1~~c3425_g1_i1.p1  ORF type:complete len:244 (+),score=46.99 c3425_g1_i1:36-767(+)
MGGTSSTPQPSPELIKAAEVLKEKYDTNKDGKLSKEELAAIAEDFKNQKMAPHVTQVVKKWDTNQDGTIDEHELKKMDEDIKSTDTAIRYAGYLGIAARSARYLAFTSDFGEAFRPVAHPRLVTASYGISWLYCAGDVAYEAYKAKTHHGVQGSELTQLVVERSIFQAVASMLIPATLIHTQVHIFHKITHKIGRFQRWGPSAAGLMLIPFFPLVLDEPVEHAVHTVLRKFGPWADKEHKKNE